MCQQSLTAITPETWTGLALHDMRHDRQENQVDKAFADPLLVFWVTGGTAVRVHRSRRQHWDFRGAASHFDFYSAGTYRSIFTDGSPSLNMLVRLPQARTSALLGHDTNELGLEPCRFQFGDSLLGQLIQRLSSQARDGEPLGSLYTQALSVAVLNRLALRAGSARQQGTVKPLGATTRRLLVDLVEAHLGAPLSLADMALLAGLRSVDFMKAFKASFDITPHQYLLDRRIERARHLLQRSHSLTVIAHELGFASHAHFSATFHARTGVTPSAYRDGTRCAVACS